MDENLKRLKMELDAEINKMEGLDDVSRDKLDKLLAYLDTKVQSPDDAQNHIQLIGHLEDSVHFFEVTHPDLTMVLNKLLTMLGNLGI